MLAGLGVTVYYMLVNAPAIRAIFKLNPDPQLWFGILPISAGVFGVGLGFVVALVVSLLTLRADELSSQAYGPARRP